MKYLLTILFITSFICISQENRAYRGPINDFEGLMSNGLVKRLNKKITREFKKSNKQLLVITSPDLNNKLITPNFLKTLFQQWGTTQEQLKSTVVLFVSQAKSKTQLFIGRNAEVSISSADKKVILDNIIKPKIDLGDFQGAIKDGVKSILKYFKQ